MWKWGISTTAAARPSTGGRVPPGGARASPLGSPFTPSCHQRERTRPRTAGDSTTGRGRVAVPPARPVQHLPQRASLAPDVETQWQQLSEQWQQLPFHGQTSEEALAEAQEAYVQGLKQQLELQRVKSELATAQLATVGGLLFGGGSSISDLERRQRRLQAEIQMLSSQLSNDDSHTSEDSLSLSSQDGRHTGGEEANELAREPPMKPGVGVEVSADSVFDEAMAFIDNEASQDSV